MSIDIPKKTSKQETNQIQQMVRDMDSCWDMLLIALERLEQKTEGRLMIHTAMGKIRDFHKDKDQITQDIQDIELEIIVQLNTFLKSIVKIKSLGTPDLNSGSIEWVLNDFFEWFGGRSALKFGSIDRFAIIIVKCIIENIDPPEIRLWYEKLNKKPILTQLNENLRQVLLDTTNLLQEGIVLAAKLEEEEQKKRDTDKEKNKELNKDLKTESDSFTMSIHIRGTKIDGVSRFVNLFYFSESELCSNLLAQFYPDLSIQISSMDKFWKSQLAIIFPQLIENISDEKLKTFAEFINNYYLNPKKEV